MLGAQGTFLGAQDKFDMVNGGGGGGGGVAGEIGKDRGEKGGVNCGNIGRGPGSEIFHETLIWSNTNQILK